jgi:hypothetical protein
MRFFPRRDKQKAKDSQQAILDATKSLREVRERDDEVHQISGALRTIRERNHFAEQLQVIMERG